MSVEKILNDNLVLSKSREEDGEGGIRSLNAQIQYFFLKLRKVSISSSSNSRSKPWMKVPNS